MSTSTPAAYEAWFVSGAMGEAELEWILAAARKAAEATATG